MTFDEQLEQILLTFYFERSLVPDDAHVEVFAMPYIKARESIKALMKTGSEDE